ncbi:MAG: hypothetical protein H6799_00280 [Candidatus Nomurabacteria bacterium]|nr:MAG: hypothetical protein H6799_00280 [Candidatus Nomurabacteria bacterium]HRV76131.1 hypothetical protein [Candidatus Saccharimonadales bacterium]
MLVISESIAGRRVMSIHAGAPIASINEAIIDPSNLKISAFSVYSQNLQFFSVVHSSDIREWSNLGLVINSEDDVMEVDDNMPKIKKLVESKFKLDGINVRTSSGKRIGKVKNYVFETDGYFIVKLYVEKTVILSLFSQPLIIGRDAVINVTDKYIVISDESAKVRVKRNKEAVDYGFSAQSSEAANDIASDQVGKT